MTRRLILIRHAKSDWDSPGSDHHRGLNKRGYKSASAIGEWLRGQGYDADEVLCSDAKRTKETCARVRFKPEPRFLSSLYLAAPEEMRTALQSAQGHTVAMIGHNPGIAEFAKELVEMLPQHPRFLDYPTCATTVLEFDITNWSHLRLHSGRVLDFVIPRELF